MIDPYATKVLNKEQHGRLVANLDNFALDAGIQKQWIWTPLPDAIGPDERTYLLKLRYHAKYGTRAGMCYTGDSDGVDDRFFALTGLLVRNFIRARYVTLAEVLSAIPDGSLAEYTCLLIPNFFLADYTTVSKKEATMLYDFLLDRKASGKQTILFIDDLNAFGGAFGMPMSSFVTSNYEVFEL